MSLTGAQGIVRPYGDTTGDGRVQVSVDDSGPGISPQARHRIFDRFHRATDQVGGSGLGLAIAKALVEVQGGRIWVESTLGEGTIFFFSLPTNADE